MNDLILYELLKRKQLDELSPAEEQLLTIWYKNLEHSPAKRSHIRLIKRRVWSSIQGKLSLPEDRSISWTRYIVAASMVAFILGGAWYITHTNKRNLENIRDGANQPEKIQWRR